MSNTFAYTPNTIRDKYGKQLGLPGYGLYNLLSSYCNGSRECFPSVKTMADTIGTDTRTILRKLKLLERVGVIEIIRKNGSHNIYRLIETSDKNDTALLATTINSVTTTSVKNDTLRIPIEEYQEEDNILFNKDEPAILAPSRDEEFNRFWESCRNKAEKKSAKPAWKKAIIVFRISNDTLIAKYQEYALSQESKGLTTQAAVRWLNGERWNETPVTPILNGGNHVKLGKPSGKWNVSAKYANVPVFSGGDDDDAD